MIPLLVVLGVIALFVSLVLGLGYFDKIVTFFRPAKPKPRKRKGKK